MATRLLKLEPTTSTTTIPAFLLKLRGLLDDEDTDDWICWDDTGDSFHLFNQAEFARQVLPKYFKHNNLASFVRQLNMYGFKKVSTIDSGSLHSRENMEFQNPAFVRDHPELMPNIKRKNPRTDVKTSIIGATTTRDRLADYCSSAIAPNQISDVLVDVSTLKNSQKGVNDQLDIIKRENGVLWREIASLRQKYQQQQAIINKLIQFLMTITGSKRRTNLKRPHQLMIEQGPSPPKRMQVAPQSPEFDPSLFVNSFNSSVSSSNGDGGLSNEGVTIREVSDDDATPFHAATTTVSSANTRGKTAAHNRTQSIYTPYSNPDTREAPPGYQDVISQSPIVTSPAKSTEESDAVLPTNDILATSSNVEPPPGVDSATFKSQFSENIDDIQFDIEMLKDIFSNEGIGLHADTLNNLFDGSTTTIPASLGTPGTPDLTDLFSENTGNNFLENAPSELPADIINMPSSDNGGVGDLDELLEQQENNGPSTTVISSNDLD